MRVKFQGGTTPRRKGPSRLPLLLTFLVVLIGATIAGSRYLLYLRSPDAILAKSAERATATRDRLVAEELAWAEAAASTALASVQNGPIGAGRILAATPGPERSLLLRSGNSILAAVGPQRFVPPPGPDGVRLVATPFEHAIVLRKSEDTLTVDVTILLDAVAGIQRTGSSLAERAEGSPKARWEWGPLSIPSDVTDLTGGGLLVAQVMRAHEARYSDLVERETAFGWRLLVVGLLLLSLIWAVFPLSEGSRGIGAIAPLWILVLAGGVPRSLGWQCAIAALSGISALLLLSTVRSKDFGAARWSFLLAVSGIAATPFVGPTLAEWVVPGEASNLLGNWFLWQIAVALAVFAWLVLIAGRTTFTVPPRAGTRNSIIAVVAILVAGIAGIEAWQPADGWKLWYLPICWVGLGSLLLPMNSRGRWVAISTAAAVVALLGTWGTSLSRRMTSAQADLQRLVSPVDGAATAALDDFAVTALDLHTTRLDPLFAAWSASPLAQLPVPTHLAISDGSGRWLGTVALDSVGVNWGDLDSLVAVAGRHPYRTELIREGIAYQILVVPFEGDTVATVAIGPRTVLLAPTRFGRLVGWRRNDAPSYTLTSIGGKTLPEPADFDRRRRNLKSTTVIGTAENGLAVRANIAIPSPQPYAVRASLALLLDVGGLLGVFWLVAWSLGLVRLRRSGWLRPSYRTMVAGALTAFFVVPAMLFTLWSVVRLRQESGQRRGEEVQRKLRSPDAYRGVQIAEATAPQNDSLRVVAYDIDAELGVYRNQYLTAASTPTLAALGILPVVIPPRLIPAGTLRGEPVIATLPWLPARLGLQEVDDSAHSYLAAVLPGGSPVAAEQLDLLFLLLLTTLTGGLASFWVADRVARTLAAPIERLTQSALAFGRGDSMPVPPPPGEIPDEFVPVFDAMSEMVEDLRASEAERAEATAQTARVLAWGEMARQVAHEIKNPLTPMRLGLQHLQRLHSDQRADFPEQVGATAQRLLSEVDRLDRIARAFARYGSPPSENEPIVRIQIEPVLKEIVELFALAGGPPLIHLEVLESVPVAVRREELIQVLLNLLENARHAGGRSVRITLAATLLSVSDDGEGIPADQLQRVFDPTFSTTTSGTGLGLPIVRRLVEGWGAAVNLRSVVGAGTTVEVRFAM